MSASAGENYPVQGENVPVCMSAHPLVENVPFRVKMPQFSLERMSVSKGDRSGSKWQCCAQGVISSITMLPSRVVSAPLVKFRTMGSDTNG